MSSSVGRMSLNVILGVGCGAALVGFTSLFSLENEGSIIWVVGLGLGMGLISGLFEGRDPGASEARSRRRSRNRSERLADLGGIVSMFVGMVLVPVVLAGQKWDTAAAFAMAIIVGRWVGIGIIDMRSASSRRTTFQGWRNLGIQGMTGLAAMVAGPRHTSGYDEWIADLAGTPEEERPLNRWAQMRLACGFLWAAIRMRLRDASTWVGRHLDWLLSTDARVVTTIAFAVGASIPALFQDGEVIESFAVLGAIAITLWGIAAILRRQRGIQVTRGEPVSRPSSAGTTLSTQPTENPVEPTSGRVNGKEGT